MWNSLYFLIFLISVLSKCGQILLKDLGLYNAYLYYAYSK
nr:MAG TPA: hypothetical protein [Caudoviricetes sp.]